jgi:hypothetical protein
MSRPKCPPLMTVTWKEQGSVGRALTRTFCPWQLASPDNVAIATRPHGTTRRTPSPGSASHDKPTRIKTKSKLVAGHYSLWKLKNSTSTKSEEKKNSVEAICMHNGLAHEETNANGSSYALWVDLEAMLNVVFQDKNGDGKEENVILCWPENQHCDMVLRQECRNRSIFITDYTIAVQYKSKCVCVCVCLCDRDICILFVRVDLCGCMF